MPGGCNFGTRPIDLHLKGFRALGANVIVENGIVKAYADKLIGTSIYMDRKCGEQQLILCLLLLWQKENSN